MAFRLVWSIVSVQCALSRATQCSADSQGSLAAIDVDGLRLSGSRDIFSLMQKDFDMRRRSHLSTAVFQQPARPSSGPPAAEHDETSPMTSWCITILVLQYFFVHALLNLMVNIAQLRGTPRGGLFKALNRTTASMGLLPCIGALILVVDLRAEQLSKELATPNLYGLPQWWVSAAALVIVVVTICAWAFHFFTMVFGRGSNTLASLCFGFFMAARFLAMVLQYVAAGVVVAGVVVMQEPFDVWLSNNRVGVTASMSCMISLLIQNFSFALVSTASHVVDASAKLEAPSMATKALESARSSQNLGTMLLVLFVTAQLRAWQFPDAEPQIWADVFFYICTYGLLVQTLLAMVLSVVDDLDGESKFPEDAGDDERPRERSMTAKVLQVLRGFCILCVYAGMIVIIVSLFHHKVPPGSTEQTDLTSLFVAVLTMQYMVASSWWFVANKLVQANSQEDTCSYVPVLGILFLGSRVRALQVSVGVVPPYWVEDFMMIGMCGSLVQYAAAVAARLLTAPPSQEALRADQQKCGVILALIVQWAGLICMYTAVVAIVVGLFTMGPMSVHS